MGHRVEDINKPNIYAREYDKYLRGEITEDAFLEWYRNAKNYEPQLPCYNRGLKEKEMKKEIRLMLEYECYPLWVYDEKGSLIDNDLIDEIKKDNTLCGMLEGLQTEFERLYVNNQVEFKYVGFSSENAKQNFAEKVENIHSRLCKLLEDKYTVKNMIDIQTLHAGGISEINKYKGI